MKERLNVLNDFAFQKAFGEKGDEPQLLSFLRAALERTGKGNIGFVEIIQDRDLSSETIGGKLGRLDVLARLSDGSEVNIEVQIKNEHNIQKRSLYYWSRRYAANFMSGEDYGELVPVIAINIIDFPLFEIDDFHTSFHLWEDRNKDQLLLDVCEIHFLDMTKFRKMKSYDLENPLHRWLIYFNDRSPEGLIEEVIKMDDYIQMVRDRLETLSQSPEEMRAYTRYSKALSDYVSNVNGARREGRIEGEKAGRIEGEKAGELSNKIKTAKIALAKGYSVTEITELTGLSAEEIAGL